MTNRKLNKPERRTQACAKLVRSLQLHPPSAGMNIGCSLAIILLCCAYLAAGCAPLEQGEPGAAWEYADLRQLSPYDEGSSEGDLIAAYARFAGSDFQVRLDLLELGSFPQTDFYLALDFRPGGSQILPINASSPLQWDILLYLPSTGIPQAFSPPDQDESSPRSASRPALTLRDDLIPRITRLPWQDYVLISINRTSLPHLTKAIKIQAFSTPAGSEQLRDSIGPFDLEGPPPGQAPMLLAFWNTLPAYTPAQSLRKWDGAHTGPFGERHGLSVLLSNVRRSAVPVVLLDLRSPAALSALDHLHGLPLVKSLLANRLLTLPDSLAGSPTFPLFPDGLPGWAASYYPTYTNLVSEQFDLPHSDFLYTPRGLDEVDPGYALLFAPAGQSSASAAVIPLPPQVPLESQATSDGPSLAIRKTLLENALQRTRDAGAYPLLVLGGDLQESALGDPAASAATLRYLANHPWIKPLNQDDLRTLPRSVKPQILPGYTFPVATEQYSPASLLSIFPRPETWTSEHLYQAAWEAALSLYAPLPPEPASLAQLRAIYSGEVGILLEAARWALNPQTRQDCFIDPDQDGIPECVLATEDQLAIIDPQGARLVAYFYRNHSDTHQLVAPTTQMIAGLGDASTWDFAAGEGADPASLPGAFVDTAPPWLIYRLAQGESQFTFTSPEDQVEKTFSLDDSGLQVSYHALQPVHGTIPIAIDPWKRFAPGWSSLYQVRPIEGGFRLDVGDEVSLQVTADLPLSAYSFKDSGAYLDAPEDPNFGYPPGHYLPYPFTVIEFQVQGDHSFVITPLD